MKKVIILFLIFLHFGCSDLAGNPTSPDQYQTVPQPVLQIIDNRCAFCHQPEKDSIVFKSQKPYFRNRHPDSSNTFLDTIQIWQSKERIGIRVRERTMPRLSETIDPTDTINVVFPLPTTLFDTIVNWAESE